MTARVLTLMLLTLGGGLSAQAPPPEEPPPSMGKLLAVGRRGGRRASWLIAIARYALLLFLLCGHRASAQGPHRAPRPQAEDRGFPAAAAWTAGIAGSVLGGSAGAYLGHELTRSRNLARGTGGANLRALGFLVGSAATAALAVHLVDRQHGRASDALAGAILGTAAALVIAGANGSGDLDGLIIMLPLGQATVATLFSLLGHP